MILDILDLYNKNRISKEDDIYNVNYLENLYFKDNKKLHFIIFYYYLSKSIIPLEVRESNLISLIVKDLVNSVNDKDIENYYKQYFNLDETSSQWKKIYNELQMINKRNKTVSNIINNSRKE